MRIHCRLRTPINSFAASNMSTFPRRVKSPLTPQGMSTASVALSRATSDFDAGINSSVAWTEHLERELCLSDEEKDDVDEAEEKGLPARVLYDFEGKAEFRELSLTSGDELEVLKEDLAEGWSLAKYKGEVGLVPRTYYAVCAFVLLLRRLTEIYYIVYFQFHVLAGTESAT